MMNQCPNVLPLSGFLFLSVFAGFDVSLLPAAGPPAGVSAAAAYQRMISLAGEWVGTIHTPVGAPARIVYRVTSAGKTVMETLGPGTDHEMVSMYHRDGPALVMTHYCSAGNQPHLRFNESKSTPTEFVFDFVGGTNLDPDRDEHIHGLILRFKSENRIEAEWTGFKDGKKADVMLFLVTRKK